MVLPTVVLQDALETEVRVAVGAPAVSLHGQIVFLASLPAPILRDEQLVNGMFCDRCFGAIDSPVLNELLGHFADLFLHVAKGKIIGLFLTTAATFVLARKGTLNLGEHWRRHTF